MLLQAVAECHEEALNLELAKTQNLLDQSEKNKMTGTLVWIYTVQTT